MIFQAKGWAEGYRLLHELYTQLYASNKDTRNVEYIYQRYEQLSDQVDTTTYSFQLSESGVAVRDGRAEIRKQMHKDRELFSLIET